MSECGPKPSRGSDGGLEAGDRAAAPVFKHGRRGATEPDADVGLRASRVSAQNAALGHHVNTIQRSANSARSSAAGTDLLGHWGPDDYGGAGYHAAAGAHEDAEADPAAA